MIRLRDQFRKCSLDSLGMEYFKEILFQILTRLSICSLLGQLHVVQLSIESLFLGVERSSISLCRRSEQAR